MAASVAAAMKFSPAMEVSTTSVEFTATMKLAATMEAAAPKAFVLKSTTAKTLKPAASKTVMIPATSAEAAITPAATETPGIPARMTVIPVVPRAHANEYAVHKPLRPVISVGRAGIRIVIIVAVSANWWRANVSRPIVAGPHSNANNHSLRAGKRRAKEANAK